ncbi:MAG: hypothetical protein RR476_07050, partial [Cetobacterium sp.]
MLKAINPFEKFLMSMGTTIILISLKNEQLNMVMVVVLAMILFFQKISMKRLTFFFLPPLIFLIPTILAQGISFTPEVKFVFDKVVSSMNNYDFTTLSDLNKFNNYYDFKGPVLSSIDNS